MEKTASPYHDWNERITEECYAANLAARILDSSGQIVSIINNYARLSFDFGPTLLGWLEANEPDVYTAIIESDRLNAQNYSGHGPAVAQAYNHMIMPLANRRDKETQVIWGIADFRRRFGREPEGMWLPETAVDLETMDIIAEHGITFTILAPHQAGRIRTSGGRWHDGGAQIDTTQPYRCPLPSGRSIAIFFYNADISHAVAFEGLLHSGDDVVNRVLSSFDPGDRPQLLTLATDGETYGHHHRFGEMALAYALDRLESSGIRVTNPAEYLALFPPSQEVEVIENSAWSCDHGIERWRSGCCCSTGLHPGWSQDWREPLRLAMDLNRDRLAPVFERETGVFLKDPWAARDDYQTVIADRRIENINSFFSHWTKKRLTPQEQTRALKLLEMQRHLMASFTSCGWFFDDISGLESTLVMKHASRALQQAQELDFETPEGEFLDILSGAKSNDPVAGNGRDIFERQVRPLAGDLKKAAAHFAMSSFFEEYAAENTFYVYNILITDLKYFSSEAMRLTGGDITVTSNITQEKVRLKYAAMLWGKHELHCGLSDYRDEMDYQEFLSALQDLLNKADCDGCLKFLKSRFPGSVYDLDSLFSDGKAEVISRIIAGILKEAEEAHREIYRRHRKTMRFLATQGQSAPLQFVASATFVLNMDIGRELEIENPKLESIQSLLSEAELWGAGLNTKEISYSLSIRLEKILSRLADNPDDTAAMTKAAGLLRLFKDTSLSPNLWRAQNFFFSIIKGPYHQRLEKPEYETWRNNFRELGSLLNVKVD